MGKWSWLSNDSAARYDVFGEITWDISFNRSDTALAASEFVLNKKTTDPNVMLTTITSFC